MSMVHNRIMRFLKFTDMELKEYYEPSLLDFNVPVWCYHIHPDDIILWIYEFENWEQLDKSAGELENLTLSENQSLDFAENGIVLLVVLFKNENMNKYQINSILDVFSGEE